MKTATKDSVIFTFGRFQPPTIGHQLLINQIKQTANESNADYVIYVSKTCDPKKNPLSIDDKMKYLNLMFPNTNFIAADNKVRTPMEAAIQLNQDYKNLVMLVGEDRAASFKSILTAYQGKEYNYESIEVISAGIRNNTDTIQGISGTRIRAAAINNNVEEFKAGLPNTLSERDIMRLMELIQRGTTSKIDEVSTEKLAQYKKAASSSASVADAAGDYKLGDKRFKGIVNATKKQFDNDKKANECGNIE